LERISHCFSSRAEDGEGKDTDCTNAVVVVTSASCDSHVPQSLPRLIATFPVIDKPGPQGQAGFGPAQGQRGQEPGLPQEPALPMASVSEATELSQPAWCRASPSARLLPLTSSVGKAEGAPAFPTGKPQLRTGAGCEGDGQPRGSRGGVGRGLGREWLAPPSSWAGALTLQDSTAEQGALQPLAGGPSCHD